MITVPYFCPDVRPLKKNPVFLYYSDGFLKPHPFQADIAVSVDNVFETKLDAIHELTSQAYEGGPTAVKSTCAAFRRLQIPRPTRCGSRRSGPRGSRPKPTGFATFGSAAMARRKGRPFVLRRRSRSANTAAARTPKKCVGCSLSSPKRNRDADVPGGRRRHGNCDLRPDQRPCARISWECHCKDDWVLGGIRLLAIQRLSMLPTENEVTFALRRSRHMKGPRAIFLEGNFPDHGA